jgi:hypothetical protein
MTDDLVAFLRARLAEDQRTGPFTARAFRDIEAKLRIIARWDDLRGEVAHWRAQDDDDAAPVATEFAYSEVAKMLASVYDDHPDYRRDWRPA